METMRETTTQIQCSVYLSDLVYSTTLSELLPQAKMLKRGPGKPGSSGPFPNWARLGFG